MQRDHKINPAHYSREHSKRFTTSFYIAHTDHALLNAAKYAHFYTNKRQMHYTVKEQAFVKTPFSKRYLKRH